MRATVQLFIFCFVIFTLNSCLDLEEKIFLRKDGSGSYSFKIELKDSIMNNMESAMQNAVADSSDISFNQSSIGEQQELIQGLGQIEKDLKNTQGIENVKLNIDDSKFKYAFSFDFKSVNALNDGLRKIAAIQNSKNKNATKAIIPAQLISFSNNILKRNHDENLAKIIQMKQLPEKKDATYLMLAAIFQDLTFKSIYQFEGEVKSYSNKAVSLSEDKKTMTSICKPFSSIKSGSEGDPCSFANQIQFK